MPLTLNETRISTSNPLYNNLLHQLQANILKHHGREHAAHLFIKILPNKIKETKAAIARIASTKITTAKQQLDHAAKRKKDKKFDGGLVCTLSLAHSAYSKLNINASNIPNDEAFEQGMKARANNLADTPNNWEENYKTQADILVLLADENKNTLDAAVATFINDNSNWAEVIITQYGQAIKNEHHIGVEHFGYADGVSQPLFLNDEVAAQANHKHWQDEARLSLALLPDPGATKEDCFGSYLVFRKLEQNVKAFKAAEHELAAIQDKQGNENEELKGAMIVGRFEDGTEVVHNDHEKLIDSEDKLNNDFDYATDPKANKCPFHAHIRVTNPRADLGNTDIDSFAQKVRIVRRGIPYQNKELQIDEQPENGVGLLFMCYQSNIAAQFEFIQNQWANNGEIGLNNFVGQDGIIGQGQNAFNKFMPTQWGNSLLKSKCAFSNPQNNFVKMLGGDYFFTPSIDFLNNL